MARLLIYGANGFTGRQIVAKAVARGLAPILGGRDGAELAAIGRQFGLGHRQFRLDDPVAIDAGLEGIEAVLHCAGPFHDTALPIAEACLRRRAHYLDIAGEYQVFEAIAARDAELRAAGVMAMCGVGGDVVPTDCLSAHLLRRMPQAERLVIYMRGLERPSSGTAASFINGMGLPNIVRWNHRLTPDPCDDVRHVRISGRRLRMIGVPWADIVSAWHSTGVPNIKVYMSLWPGAVDMIRLTRRAPRFCQAPSTRALLKRLAKRWVRGPDADFRAQQSIEYLAEMTDRAGTTLRTYLKTKEAYALTAEAAVEIALRVLAGAIKPGFQTPSSLLGPDLILDIPGSTRRDEP